MMLNGILIGLIGITAGADLMSPNDGMIISLIAGILITLSVILLDKLKINDPVGAIPIHLICGIWCALVVALFSSKFSRKQLITQAIGILTIGILCLLIFLLLKVTIGIRMNEKEELECLDLHENGMKTYADFRPNNH